MVLKDRRTIADKRRFAIRSPLALVGIVVTRQRMDLARSF